MMDLSHLGFPDPGVGTCIRETGRGPEEEKAFREEVLFEVKSERQVGDCKHFKHRQELEEKPQGKREQGVFEDLKEGDCGVEVKVTTGKAGEIPRACSCRSL